MARKSSMRERARKRAEERESSGGNWKFKVEDGVEFYQAKKGTAYLDFLPYEVTSKNHPEVDKGDNWYQRTLWVHYNVGPDEKVVICPKKTVGMKCPICEALVQMQSERNPDEEAIKALRAKEREVFNVIDLDDEDKGIQLFEMSYHLFGKKLEEEIREGDPDWGGFAELEKGYTLKVRWSEKKLGRNAFVEASRIDFEERDDYPEKKLDEVYNLDDILLINSYDALEKMLMGLEEPEDNGDEKEKEEKSSRRGSRGRNKDKEKEEDKGSRRSSRRGKKDEEKEDKGSRRSSSRGRGKNEDEEKEDTGKEKTSSRRNPKKEKEKEKEKETETGEGECPSGGSFGEDCNKLDACDECSQDIWEACQEAQDAG